MIFVKEYGKKRGEYLAVTRPTQGLFLNEECRMKNVECRMKNEECRMKNEEWELLFLFVKREEGKIALTKYGRDGGDASYILYR